MRTQPYILALTLCACSGRAVIQNDPYQAYGEQQYTAIGDTSASGSSGAASTGGTVSASELDGGQCIEVVDGECIKPELSGPFCDGSNTGPVDTVVVEGEVKASVCYPSPEDSTRPVTVSDIADTPNVAKTANGTAIVFSAETDGKPIAGPLEISANNVSIYGNGPDKTIIEGDVHLAKNGARLRGIRIKGNLYVDFNDVSVVLCQIDGNVITAKNNGLFASNVIFGNVEAQGNGNQFYFNRVSGSFTAKATSEACAGNHAFVDGNSDKIVQSDELGTELSCQ